MSVGGPVLIIGVGNRDRGDDGVGPAVVDEIRRRGVPVRTVIREGDLTALLLDWGPDDDVTIVDCAGGNGAAGTGAIGTVRVVGAGELAPTDTTSTHGMGVAESVHLAESMDRLPRCLRVVGITGRSFRHGPISPELGRRVPEITDEVLGLALAPHPAVDTRLPSSSADA